MRELTNFQSRSSQRHGLSTKPLLEHKSACVPELEVGPSEALALAIPWPTTTWYSPLSNQPCDGSANSAVSFRGQAKSEVLTCPGPSAWQVIDGVSCCSQSQSHGSDCVRVFS